MKKDIFICGLDAALFVLGGKWKPLILFHRLKSFGQVRRGN